MQWGERQFLIFALALHAVPAEYHEPDIPEVPNVEQPTGPAVDDDVISVSSSDESLFTYYFGRPRQRRTPSSTTPSSPRPHTAPE